MRIIVLLILCAFLAIGAALAARPDAASSPSASVQPAATGDTSLTPAAALILHECAKTVLAGEGTVPMRHIAQIDDCAARVRAMILAH